MSFNEIKYNMLKMVRHVLQNVSQCDAYAHLFKLRIRQRLLHLRLSTETVFFRPNQLEKHILD